MSSLAATQADGYYLPPEYFEGGAYKKQSKNAFHAASQHNNSKNSKPPGHNQWLQRGVVRFELPYKGVCEGLNCSQPSIMRGTRYNAKKITTDEKYFSSPIYEFQMSCRLCQHPWVIRTNPKERGFDYVSGIHIQAGQESIVDMTGSSGAVASDADAQHDALHRLESTAHGKQNAMTEIEELQKIQKLNQSSLNDADHNAVIRKGFRKDRKDKRKRQEHATKIGWRRGMEMLSEDTPMDVLASKEMTYGNPKKEERKRLRTVRTASIFSSPTIKKRRRSFSEVPPSPVRSSSSSVTNTKTEPITNDHDPNHSVATRNQKTKKKRLKIGAGKVVLQEAKPRDQSNDAAASNTGETTRIKQDPKVEKAGSSTLSDMLAGYDSSDEEDDD